jgi:signal transduction histidine kinase
MVRRSFTLRSQHVLYGLALGFLLVLLLLGASGWVAVMRSQLISENVAKLARDHFLIARLIHDVQTSQNAMTEVLQRVVQPGPKQPAPLELLRNLEESSQPLAQLSGEVRTIAVGPLWMELEATMKSFGDNIRQVLSTDTPATPAQVRALFDQNNRMISQVNELVRRSSNRLAEAEREIESQSEKLRRNSTFLLGASLLLAVACAATTIMFVRQSIHRMKRQSSELDRVSWHMLQGQEHAARRFSHELHDELGQSLAAVRSNLTKQGNNNIESLRADCLQLVDHSIANVRELSQLLRPVILDDFGLEAGLQWLAESFSQRTRLAVDFKANGIRRYSDETETHLFRIAQEAFTNIARHSVATAVTVRLHSDGSIILLRIEDNGQGLAKDDDKGPKAPTLGMVGMRARARQCGGDFSVSKVEPHGLRIEVTVPVRLPQPESAD